MKRLKDERISEAFDNIASKMYWVMLVLLFGLLLYKLSIRAEFLIYGLELLCFIITIPYLITTLAFKHLLFIKTPDSCILQLKRKLYSRCFMICFWIIIIGEFLLMLIIPNQISVLALYLIAWMIPALIITVYSIKNGLLIWGGVQRKKTGVKSFKKRVVVGSLFFGIFMGAPFTFANGTFHPVGLLWIIGMAIGWGLPFYFVFMFMMKKSEKLADKQVNLVSNENEKDF